MARRLRPVEEEDFDTKADDEELYVVARRPVFPEDAPEPVLWPGLQPAELARRRPKRGTRERGYSWFTVVGDLREQIILEWGGVSLDEWSSADPSAREGLLQAARLILLARSAMRHIVRSSTPQVSLWLDAMKALSKTVDSLTKSREKPLYALNRERAQERLTAERPVVIRELSRLKSRVQELEGDARATRFATELTKLFFGTFGHRHYQLERADVVALRQKSPTEIFAMLVKRGRFGRDTALSYDDLVRTKIRTRRSRRAQ